VIERLRTSGKIGRQRGPLGERDVMVMQLAIKHATVEAHRLAAGRVTTRRANFPEAETLGPKVVRCLKVANIQNEVIETARRLRLGFRFPFSCHVLLLGRNDY
jgi:hypothetical protein